MRSGEDVQDGCWDLDAGRQRGNVLLGTDRRRLVISAPTPGDLEIEPLPEDMLEHREALTDSGIPEIPEAPTVHWGATKGPWGARIYADGSGLANSSPELRRCGWAAVGVDQWGVLRRALYSLAWAPGGAPRRE
eukprot:710196-Pyramimonas_sp.AAC.1